MWAHASSQMIQKSIQCFTFPGCLGQSSTGLLHEYGSGMSIVVEYAG